MFRSWYRTMLNTHEFLFTLPRIFFHSSLKCSFHSFCTNLFVSHVITFPSKPDVTRRRVFVSYSMFFTQLACPWSEQTFEFSLRRSHNAIVVSSEQVANKRLSKNLQDKERKRAFSFPDILHSSLILQSAFLLASALYFVTEGFIECTLTNNRNDLHDHAVCMIPLIAFSFTTLSVGLVFQGALSLLTLPVGSQIRETHLMLLTQSSWASVKVLMCLDEMGSNSRTSVCSQATVSTDLRERADKQQEERVDLSAMLQSTAWDFRYPTQLHTPVNISSKLKSIRVLCSSKKLNFT